MRLLNWVTKNDNQPAIHPQKKRVFIFSLIMTGVFLLAGVGYYLHLKQDWAARERSKKNNPNPAEAQITDNNGQIRKIENCVRKGDTIINALRREGLDHQAAFKLFSEVKPVYNLKNINAGKPYTLLMRDEQAEKDLVGFKYQIDINQHLEVYMDEAAGAYKARIITIPFEERKAIIRGGIEYSLFESIRSMNEKPELADILASLYEYDIDFNRDLREGDHFSVIVEKKYLKGEFVAYGAVLAAEFVNQGKAIQLVRYTDPEGKTAYYHPDGRSARKMFLRCPLPFMRVTSRYGFRKSHPVLGYSTQHRGVDFGAPTGSLVRASSSGVIQASGSDATRGRYILIRHPNQYISHYYHLSGFARGIRTGVRVDQGQEIGYVGSTGLSTGPHLHYGLQKGGLYLNPLNMEAPPKEPVNAAYMKEFKNHVMRHFLLLTGEKFHPLPDPIKNFMLAPNRPPMIKPSESLKF